MKALLIDNTTVEEVDVDLTGGELTIDVSPQDYEDATAQVWGGQEEGAKGVRIAYCLGELPVETLARACFDDTVWLHLHLTDAIDHVVSDYTATDDGWTKEGVLSLANQFEEFAERLRKAVK